MKKVKIALICGGPSPERGISLNSARSVMDHLQDEQIEIIPIYFDTHLNAYAISKSQLYSNTPSDFDFKLQDTAKFLTKKTLKETLQKVDIAFPVMHGLFGEDGQIQSLLERYKIPYIASDSNSCKLCFNKHKANEFIKNKGFFTLPSIILEKKSNNNLQKLSKFFKENKIKRAVVKPATGGSSIGVFSVSNENEAIEKMNIIFKKRFDDRVVVEPFCDGKEFTIIVLQNRFRMPVAIIPTEIETDYSDHQVFDFRKKYLPTNQVRYHCPPRFDNETIEKIQVLAEQLFSILGLRDFARIDGWLLDDGNIWFSDINPISGMEQNSFLFQQSSQIGLSHKDLLRFIVKRAMERENIDISKLNSSQSKKSVKRKKINVIFGGDTAERQVSLMSGTNVWLKLRASKKYEPKPFLLDMKNRVWKLPYAFTLHHTVEEIMENCEKAKEDYKKLSFLIQKTKLRLALEEGDLNEASFIPKKMTLEELAKKSKFIFIGLHGGFGEDGRFQKFLDNKNVLYNGSGPKASKICMDKYVTGKKLENLEKYGILTTKKIKFNINEKPNWKKICDYLGTSNIIVKPVDDGCSAGVICLHNEKELLTYINIVKKQYLRIPSNTFKNQTEIIEMPSYKLSEVLFEPFIETDRIKVQKNKLKWKKVSNKIEVTIGVIEKNGVMKAMSPSLTVAEGKVLSVEEKFQGGTGINLTPPPEKFVNKKVCLKAKKAAEKVCEVLGIRGYCRVDTFMDVKTGDITVIEINSTPGLTASTVFYHQALAENPPMFPTEILELLIKNKGY